MSERVIAYFSMEIALEAGMPTYAGGLGILAGDTLRSAADLKFSMVGVTLLYRKGHFRQRLGPNGEQLEESEEWKVEDFLRERPERVSVAIEGREVRLRAWEYIVRGIEGGAVHVYFLDSDLPENTEADRTFTHVLYGGDERYRLCQELILGVGGVKMLRALGYDQIVRFHMNEGHASLLTLALGDEEAHRHGRTAIATEDIEAVRKLCVFTTHTPIAAGHDQFSLHLANQIVKRPELVERKDVFCCGDMLNMTYLALNLSDYVNGVAKRHGEVTRLMFGEYPIDAITNGIRAATWTSKPFQELFDRYISDWKRDNFTLRYALGIPHAEIWNAHMTAKRELFDEVNRRQNIGMDPETLTLGFARRATGYKRADLLFQNPERLRQIAKEAGPLQIIYAGKAHPKDSFGKEMIRKIFEAREKLKDEVKIVYLENYGMELGRLLTAGVDVWLNTPHPPLEASGSSGMKAALNGVPSLSILDGWWIEGHIEGVTGWAIDDAAKAPETTDRFLHDAVSLYNKLEKSVIPIFYRDRNRFIDIMSHAIALNGSFFHTQRMIQQYILKAYFPK